MRDLIINTWYDSFVDLQKQAKVSDMLSVKSNVTRQAIEP